MTLDSRITDSSPEQLDGTLLYWQLELLEAQRILEALQRRLKAAGRIYLMDEVSDLADSLEKLRWRYTDEHEEQA